MFCVCLVCVLCVCVVRVCVFCVCFLSFCVCFCVCGYVDAVQDRIRCRVIGKISHCGVGEGGGGGRSEILHILSYKSIVYSEIVSPIGIGRSE